MNFARKNDSPDNDSLDSDSRGKGDRLQKVLALAGVGSRRKCEELMLAGRVEVDGRVVTTLGTRVCPDRQRIAVDGTPLRRPRRLYYMLNKPPGVLSTARDQWGRTRAIDLVDSQERLFTVGRLDKSSSGLILVTNDGELANCLAHPRYGVQKTYRVTVAGHLTAEQLQQLRRGVFLAEGRVRPVSLKTQRRLKQATLLEVVLAEGRNREIRRMLARVGHKVLDLQRIALGPLRLGNLPVGSHRPLKPAEIRALRELPTPRPRGSLRKPRRRPLAGEASSTRPVQRPGRAGPRAKARRD